MFATIVARWKEDSGTFNFSAYSPPMRIMFHATSSAVNWRPLNGAMLWTKSFGCTLNTSVVPLLSATSHEVRTCGLMVPALGSGSSIRSLV